MLWRFGVLFLAATLFGCAGTLAQAADPIVTGSLESLNEPENLAALGNVLGSEEVTEGARVLASEVGMGLAEGLSEEEVSRELALIARRMTDAALREFVQSFRTQIAPALADTVRTELGPALRDTFEDELAPLVREASQQITLGVVAGLEEVARRQKLAGEEESLLARLRNLAGKSVWLVWVAGLSILALLAMAIVLFIRRLKRRRRRKGDVPLTTADLEPQIAASLKRILRDPELRASLRAELDRDEPRPTH